MWNLEEQTSSILYKHRMETCLWKEGLFYSEVVYLFASLSSVPVWITAFVGESIWTACGYSNAIQHFRCFTAKDSVPERLFTAMLLFYFPKYMT